MCTISCEVEHPGVFDVPMGTSLRVDIDTAAGGVLRGVIVVSVLVGV